MWIFALLWLPHVFPGSFYFSAFKCSSWNQFGAYKGGKVWKKKYRNQVHNATFFDWFGILEFLHFWFMVDFGVCHSMVVSLLDANLFFLSAKRVVGRQRHRADEAEKAIRSKWKCEFRKEVSEIAENQQSSTHRNYRKHMKSSVAIEIVSVSEWVPQKATQKKKKEEKKESTYKVFTAACLNRLWAINVN